jgi:hypothetical protein
VRERGKERETDMEKTGKHKKQVTYDKLADERETERQRRVERERERERVDTSRG